MGTLKSHTIVQVYGSTATSSHCLAYFPLFASTMGDPLSVLGAAVGVTSLIIQLADDCIKGYKFYQEAANLPQSHRHILVRLHIEQQRFLNFALEAGVLNADRVICSTLQVNRSLLLAVLAEIKVLFDEFAASNGKYEQIVGNSDIEWKDHSEPEGDLMGLLCLKRSDQIESEGPKSASQRKEAANPVRGLRRTIAETAKSLRTIAIEPKRLVWASVDKQSFEVLVSKIENLNSFLVALLDSSQLRRLQDSMNMAYLEILQLRNDVVDLTALVKALSPISEYQRNLPPGADIANNALSRAVVEEQAAQDKQKIYLKRLVQIKIQLTKMSNLNDPPDTPDFTQLDNAQLLLEDFEFKEGALEPENLQQRTWANYHGKTVWIEWKEVPIISSFRPDDVQMQWRIGMLTDLLRSVKPDGFRAPPCLGYIKATDADDATLFGLVFEGPSSTESKIVTLRELLAEPLKPSLSTRIALCAALARCLHGLHAVNWLHKAFRSDNIIFFTSVSSPDLQSPFVSGFELSRPSNMDQWTEKPIFEPAKDIYRHPNAQSNQTDGNYLKSYDIYSLGVIMVEIALWRPIEDVIGLESLSKARPPMLQKTQQQLLRSRFKVDTVNSEFLLPQISAACGHSLCKIIEHCLNMDIESQLGSNASLQIEQVTDLNFVQKLERIAEEI
ncbi:hypothetical protein COCC4DRAFT_68577 [Bipolaris maydis ATCC 48331]|uniref:Protein kinase domain-containing protein n=2 Tax=Cochliobolus heterostrophus TaxID=5016 RepID=M2SW09_COCH5|nr:uncharacterized protein COCC4DRAFT_68577 [Bipolaris maydis ATCC 48331]EMD89535.1 hypothetical protein COCHEDRAFT_1204293 [Bipolaris maydis C5]KAJ5064349.1 prion-inhibition and propagation-domain-containing protein [Bipolaris maydis]ENI10250.1 hypothetical protein COCC4DRAFT_68577 [Bipolaris maydis ATCC 48331]KAJ6207386.1 prion-inhibition and propagation-domain-containing protein [Bipolaris maydis]KAJ6269949.1 prion-inhibition and propagation-domain-containing protein [Bipolaris maydis]